MEAIDLCERKSLFARGGWKRPGFDPNPIDQIFQKSFLSSYSQKKPLPDEWSYYFTLHLHTLQLYNLWHEDRTSSVNGIEARVPFLDHRIVEFLFRIPKKHRAELFLNKSILRKAMAPFLPEVFTAKAKNAFYGGSQVKLTRKIVWDLLKVNDFELVEKAFAGSEKIDIAAFKKAHASVGRDPDYNGIDPLMFTTNMALLEKIFTGIRSQSRYGETVITLDSKSFPSDEFNPSALEVELRGKHSALDLKAVYEWAPGVTLTQSLGGKANLWFVLRGKKVIRDLEGAEEADLIALLGKIEGSASKLESHFQKMDSKLAKTLQRSLSYLIDEGLIQKRALKNAA
jgi:asparagine synthase (glutamine-hydrolysing)